MVVTDVCVSVVWVEVATANVGEVSQGFLDSLTVFLLELQNVGMNIIKQRKIDQELLPSIVKVLWYLLVESTSVAIFSVCEVVVDQLANCLER